MPAKRAHAPGQRFQHLGGGRAPRLRRDEVDPQPRHPAIAEPVQLRVSHIGVNHGNASGAVAKLTQCVERATVVNAIRGRRHHHRA